MALLTPLAPHPGGGGSGREVLASLRAALDGSGPALGSTAAHAAGLDVPEGTAAIVSTSGSTGYPKAVVLGRDALLASARATAERIGTGSWLLALPAGYVAGLQVLTRSILAGTEPAILDGPFDPAAFAAAAEQIPRPAYTSLVPAQLARLLDSRIDLDVFAAILVGGQRLDPALLESAAALGARVVRTYGSTETSGGCVYDGLPLDGVGLRIVDGEVQVAGPMLATGYLGDERATDAAFPRDAEGVRWYRTGDAGSVGDGVVAIAGRLDDVLVSGGVNVSVDRVRAAVRAVAGLADAEVVAVPDERWGEASVIVVASGGDTAALLAAAREAVSTQIGAHARPARIVAVDAVPHLASGKPDRAALRRLATAGS